MNKSTNNFYFAPFDTSNLLPKLESQSGLQYINLREVDLKCHFDARHAFIAWHQAKTKIKEIEHKKPPFNSLYLIKERSIAVERPTYSFFQSFSTIEHRDHPKNVSPISCIIVDEPEEDVIRTYSWNELVLLVDQELLATNTGMPVLRKIINENMPAYLRLKFFNSNLLTVPKMCDGSKQIQKKFEYQQSKLKIEQEAHAAALMSHSPFTLTKILERSR